ncbi:hypothetical protein Q8F55_008124 [Vanrija albida]|uniref:Transposase n=1 Tax=Vanrija albida TaxID=181172 RepID=A0ABR3PVC7_9TREE
MPDILHIPAKYATLSTFDQLRATYDAARGGIPAPINAPTLGQLCYLALCASSRWPDAEVATFLFDVARAYDRGAVDARAAQVGAGGSGASAATNTDAKADTDADGDPATGDDDDEYDDAGTDGEDAADTDDDVSVLSAGSSATSATATTASTTAHARGRKRSRRARRDNPVLHILENIRDELADLREDMAVRAEAAADTAANPHHAADPATHGYTPPWSVRVVHAAQGCDCARCYVSPARRPLPPPHVGGPGNGVPAYWAFGPGGGW